MMGCGWWLVDGWLMVVGWWLVDGWLMVGCGWVGWWLVDGWLMVGWWMVGLVYVFFSVCLKLGAWSKKWWVSFCWKIFGENLGGIMNLWGEEISIAVNFLVFVSGISVVMRSAIKEKKLGGLFDQSATGVMILTPTQNKLVMGNFSKLPYILNCLIPPKLGTLMIPALCVDSMITSSTLKNFREKRHFLCKMNYTKMWQKLGWYCWWKKSSTTWDV